MRKTSLFPALFPLILLLPAASAQDDPKQADAGPPKIKVEIPVKAPDRSNASILITRIDEACEGGRIVETKGSRRPAVAMVMGGKVGVESESPPLSRYEIEVIVNPPVGSDAKQIRVVEKVWSTPVEPGLVGVPAAYEEWTALARDLGAALEGRAAGGRLEMAKLSRRIRDFRRDNPVMSASSTLLEKVSLGIGALAVGGRRGPQLPDLKRDYAQVDDVARREIGLLLPKLLLPVVERWKKKEADREEFVLVAGQLKDVLTKVRGNKRGTPLDAVVAAADRMAGLKPFSPPPRRGKGRAPSGSTPGEIEAALKALEAQLRTLN